MFRRNRQVPRDYLLTREQWVNRGLRAFSGNPDTGFPRSLPIQRVRKALQLNVLPALRDFRRKFSRKKNPAAPQPDCLGTPKP
ncbi:hypothetical protein [Bradyrhizobium sp.]|uniref:hypothetical protein n=1 Tax=Bradyrhizobium sp. TaxID=376 RepID=UPI003C41F229